MALIRALLHLRCGDPMPVQTRHKRRLGDEYMTCEPNERSVATYRPVIAGDLDLICRHRHEMFKASGRTDAMVQPSTNAFKAWLKPRLDDGSYFGWIAQVDGIEVAGDWE
jgi:hypothetical protein